MAGRTMQWRSGWHGQFRVGIGSTTWYVATAWNRGVTHVSRSSSIDGDGLHLKPFSQAGLVIRHSAVPYRLLLSDVDPTFV